MLSVRGIPGVVTRCCRDAGVGGRGCSGCWLASAGSVVSASPGWAGGSSAVTGLLLIWVPGVPAVTRRACASGPGQHYGPAGNGGSAEARTAIGSCPARRAVRVALVLLVLLVLLVAGEPG